MALDTVRDQEQKRQRKPHLPPIPDLRFEHSYLRSISSSVHVERLHHPRTADLQATDDETLLQNGGLDTVRRNTPAEVITVQWGRLFWVTTRDQVIAPMLQGAVWALASYWISPLFWNAGSKVGTLVRTKTQEGPAMGWLRNWIKSIGLSSTSSPQSRYK